MRKMEPSPHALLPLPSPSKLMTPPKSRPRLIDLPSRLPTNQSLTHTRVPTKVIVQRREMNRLIDVGDGTVGAHVLMPHDSFGDGLGLVCRRAVVLEGLEGVEAAADVKGLASCGEVLT
ncbi:hypothetical protein CPAR01_10836 [Colletotrichum paranaense]|uniref:Uncharacterized protein n=1 Tax=Colletotrichum paranaense TaxID=1914294 RepID=A0ABQ9S9X3_9PEZI|nr:uncharacterized protein CPAR01_10836 [Colletotrichum paranaense]KAK1531187.1 hypothetical protein CPAR01_10836 [Colletotrichum paranaense]